MCTLVGKTEKLKEMKVFQAFISECIDFMWKAFNVQSLYELLFSLLFDKVEFAVTGSKIVTIKSSIQSSASLSAIMFLKQRHTTVSPPTREKIENAQKSIDPPKLT